MFAPAQARRDMSTITFVPTQRGGTALIFDGYRYNKVRCNNDKNVTYWRCSKNRNCPGRAVTVENRVKKTNNKHNHPPEAPLPHHHHHHAHQHNPFLNMAAAAAAAQHAAAQMRALHNHHNHHQQQQHQHHHLQQQQHNQPGHHNQQLTTAAAHAQLAAVNQSLCFPSGVQQQQQQQQQLSSLISSQLAAAAAAASSSPHHAAALAAAAAAAQASNTNHHLSLLLHHHHQQQQQQRQSGSAIDGASNAHLPSHIQQQHQLLAAAASHLSQQQQVAAVLQRHQQQQQQQQQQPQQAASSHHTNNINSQASPMNNLLNHVNPNQTQNPAKKLRPNSSSGMSSTSGGLGPASLVQFGQLGQQAKNLLLANSNSLAQQVNSAAAAAFNQTPAHAHQRPKNNNLWNQPIQQARQPTPAGIAPPHVGNLNRPPITTPPNVVQAMMGGLSANQQSILMNQINALTAGAAAAASSPQGIHKRPSLSNLARQQAITTPPNVVQDVRMGQSNQHQLSTPQTSSRRTHINMSSQPITTPTNMIHDNRGSLSGQQSLLMNASNLSTPSPASGGVRTRGGGQQSIVPQQQQQQQQQQQHQQQQQQASPFNKSQAAQMLLQKRQAAKSAIQKQLEQTLMQLPEKRIQLGIDFIPNANNIEFVYYIGLEACVDYLTNSKNPLDPQPLEKPFECSTCGTDFTPSWSWKRSNPVCENCVSNHVKKSIKNSQTNRIKSVLSKAAKQEQEMDQRIMAEAASVVASSPSTTSTTSTNQRHSSLLQPTTPALRSHAQGATAWPRVNPSPLAPVSRSSNVTSNATPSPAANLLPNLNLSNPLAALGNLQPAALASLLQMNPQIGSLASLMTANAVPTSAPNNNNNQIAQVAALLMNQLTMNFWNKR